jgi:hypothetical protein
MPNPSFEILEAIERAPAENGKPAFDVRANLFTSRGTKIEIAGHRYEVDGKDPKAELMNCLCQDAKDADEEETRILKKEPGDFEQHIGVRYDANESKPMSDMKVVSEVLPVR